MLMKKYVPLMAVGAMAALPYSASAGLGEGDIAGKVGGVYVAPNETSPKIERVEFKLKKDKDPVTLSFDVLAMVSDEIGVNLGTTLPAKVKQKARTLNNDAKSDVDFNLMPLHATLQYYFLTPDDTFRPYLGAGLHYTIMDKFKIGHANLKKIEFDNTFGFLFQVGGVFALDDTMFVDMSARYFYLEPNGKAHVRFGTGPGETPRNVKAKVKNFDLNPWVFNVSFGVKF